MWISSKEFAKLHGYNIEGLLKSIKRADSVGKKFCTLKGKILPFRYTNGIGRGGKAFQILSEPFNSEREAECFILSMLQEEGKRARNGAVESFRFAQHDKGNGLPRHCYAAARNDEGNAEMFRLRAQHDKERKPNMTKKREGGGRLSMTKRKGLTWQREKLNMIKGESLT